MPCRTKLDDQAALCYYLDNADNHPRGTVKVLRESIGRVCFTKNVACVTEVPVSEGEI